MILTKSEILKEINLKRIVIKPLDKSNIGPASIDLSLGTELRIFSNKSSKINLSNKVDYKKFTKKIKLNRYELKPGELVMGITKEKICLPENICGWLQSRSRFARIGLMSHITAPFICPGVNNHQVLEIYNAGPQNIVLKPNIKICQMIFQQCLGKAKYKGKFKSQKL